MSGNLAIAAVSAVMKYLLLSPLSEDSISAVVPDLTISVIPPHEVNGPKPTLNIFFYQAMANSGWQNRDLPARNSNGERIRNPYLSLDLHYLITAHGRKDYLGEVLLGFAMQTFHENPVLTRDIIRTALTSGTLATADTPASVLTAFAAADLAEQFEQVRFSPHYPPTDEVANMWGSMSTGFVPTAYLKAAVVLIESKRPARAALPVRGFNVYAFPFNQPRIQDVIADTGVGTPILAEGQISLRGSALRGEHTIVEVGGVEILEADLDVTNEKIDLQLPSGLLAGITGVQVKHILKIGTPETDHRGLESNVAAFVLQPQITQTGSIYDIQLLDPGGPNQRLEISINPAVAADQRAEVLLNERNAPGSREAFSFNFNAQARPSGSPPETTLEYPIPAVPAGTYFVRVRINGAESPLVYVDGVGYDDPTVVLP